MEAKEEEVAEIHSMERGLLLEDEQPPLYTASFSETEENFVKYQTTRWVLYSLLLVLAWGVGLFMLIYLPIRRHILRTDIRSRKLYLTADSIVYKVFLNLSSAIVDEFLEILKFATSFIVMLAQVRRPVSFPCFGVLRKEKHVLLPSVADVAIEQGYLQSLYGIYSVRIENVGVRRPPSDDVQIQGVADPHAFREAVLLQLSNMRSEVFSRQVSVLEDISTPKVGHSSVAKRSSSKLPRLDSFTHLGEMAILQKLEEVGSSVKRVQTLIEEQNLHTPKLAD